MQFLYQRAVTCKIYENVVIKKLKKCNESRTRRAKTSMKYLQLLYDNTSAHKARTVTEYLDKVTVLEHARFLKI